MRDHDRRVSAKQLQIAAETIRKRLRGQRYRLFTRVCANIGVYTSGNEVRMGKGKGSFDHWAVRIPVSRILFELKGDDLHEQVVRDAFRLAAHKLPGTSTFSILHTRVKLTDFFPGLYEIAKKGGPPVMGITKVDVGTTVADMRKPRTKLPMDVTANRLPASAGI